MHLPYTICFCLRGEQVLMLYRRKPPNANRWNGLGGHIENGETPLVCVQREVLEEAEIDLQQAQELRYTGLVTWTDGNKPIRITGGMYAFLAYVGSDFPTWPDRSTPEGLLSWKPLAWVCDPAHTEVVSNISQFLPHMLHTSQPLEYRCHYQKHILQSMMIVELQDTFI